VAQRPVVALTPTLIVAPTPTLVMVPHQTLVLVPSPLPPSPNPHTPRNPTGFASSTTPPTNITSTTQSLPSRRPCTTTSLAAPNA
jgi:hypothetical protein